MNGDEMTKGMQRLMHSLYPEHKKFSNNVIIEKLPLVIKRKQCVGRNNKDMLHLIIINACNCMSIGYVHNYLEINLCIHNFSKFLIFIIFMSVYILANRIKSYY